MRQRSVNRERLLQRHEIFSRIGATGRGGVDRQAFSAADNQGKLLLLSWAAERHFTSFADANGNLFVRRPGRQESAAPILTGSHLDSQPTGGNFDGVFGVLASLEVLETLEDSGIKTEFPVELVVWMNEEGSRFPPPTMGSALFCGGLKSNVLDEIADSSGIKVKDALAAFQQRIQWLAPLPLPHIPSAYVEAHIEQGPRLEQTGKTIGIVTGIQGLRCMIVEVRGKEGHAGTTPMEYRTDALNDALDIIREMKDVVYDPRDELRFTVGRFDVMPNSPNTIPSMVKFTIDLRHPDIDALQRIGDLLIDICGHQRRSQVSVREQIYSPPTTFDPGIIDLISQTSSARNYPGSTLMSGATHDAKHLAALCPTGMIFIPCRGGISHSEDEYASGDHLVAGANVLLDVVTKLAGDDARKNPSHRG